MSISKDQNILEAKLLTLLLGYEITHEITRKDENFLRAFHASHNHVSHKMFRFMRECLFHYVKNFGIEEAAQKLGLSDYIIETILENMKGITKNQSNSQLVDKSEILGNKVLKNDTGEFSMEVYKSKITYPPGFKLRVVDAYLSDPRTSVIAKIFQIPRFKVKDWVSRYLQGRPFKNRSRWHFSERKTKEETEVCAQKFYI